MHGVIFEEVSQILNIAQIVDPCHLEFLFLQELFKTRPADSSETIDSHADDFLSAHVFSPYDF